MRATLEWQAVPEASHASGVTGGVRTLRSLLGRGRPLVGGGRGTHGMGRIEQRDFRNGHEGAKAL